jgi:hypothetical protein
MNTQATFPEVIDATMRSDWHTCHHKFFRRHCQGLDTSEAKSVDLHYGACLARGLEVARRTYHSGQPQGMAVVRGGEAIIHAWGGYEYTPRSKAQEQKTLDNCLLTVSDYFRQWPLDTDPIRIHVDDGEPCIEFAGGVPIPGTRHPETGEAIIYAGRFDMIGDYEASIWGLDDKSGQISNSADKWRLRSQFTGYTWIAHKYGLPIKGFIIRECQPLTSSIKFSQSITMREPWKIDRWLQTLLWDVKEMIDCWRRIEHHVEEQYAFPQVLDNGCMAFNRPCEFMPLCDAEHPERWVDGYHVNRWNPLERGA